MNNRSKHVSKKRCIHEEIKNTCYKCKNDLFIMNFLGLTQTDINECYKLQKIVNIITKQLCVHMKEKKFCKDCLISSFLI